MTAGVMDRLRQVRPDLNTGEQRRPERLHMQIPGQIPGGTSHEAALGGEDPIPPDPHVAGDPARGGADETVDGGRVEAVVGHQRGGT
jgi:hypothetical protein